MSYKKEIIEGLKGFGEGLVKGAGIIIAIAVVLILISHCAGAEEPTHVHSDSQLEELITLLTEYEVAVIEVITVDPPKDCERRNSYLQYSLDQIQKQIELHPEVAYIYADTIEFLKESWCIE